MALPIAAVKTVKKAVEKAKNAAADSDANPEESKGFIADAATCALAPGPGSPTACYVEKTDRFHYFTPTKRWAALSKQNYMDHIGRKGGGAGWSQKSVERLMVANREQRTVVYAGPLAGRKAGLLPPTSKYRQWVLSTENASPVPPVAGNWDLIYAVIYGQFVANEEESIGATQWNTFHAWMQRSYQALSEGYLAAQQALFMVGPRNCFKSYLQSYLITPMFGGGEAASFAYLSGAQFNGEFLGAFHLYWMDERLPNDRHTRETLAARLKQLTSVTGTTSYEDKGLKKVNLPTMHRLSISINDDHAALEAMPALSASVRDKIILLRCSPVKNLPVPNTTLKERAAFEALWESQIPGYVHWLMNEFKAPEGDPDDPDFMRYAVHSFTHPDVLAQVEKESPEADLLTAIDMELFPELGEASTLPTFPAAGKNADEFTVSIKALHTRLTSSSNQFVRDTAKKVLRKGSSLLPVLKHLAEAFPKRVRQNSLLKRKDLQGWTFFRAPEDNE